MKEGYLLKILIIFLISLRLTSSVLNLDLFNGYKIWIVNVFVIAMYFVSAVFIIEHKEWGALLAMGLSLFEISLIIQGQLDGIVLIILEVLLFTFAFRLYSEEHNFHKV